ncbi:MAG: WD40 repeat domain-containing protein [Pirellulales bacterium]
MNITQPQHRWQLPFEGTWPTAVTFLGSDKRLAAANQAGEIFIWDLPEQPVSAAAADSTATEPAPPAGEPKPPSAWPVLRLDGHTNGVTRLVASADGRTLVSASLDHAVRVWDTTAEPTGTAEVILDGERRKQEAQRTHKDDPLTAPGVQVQTLSTSVELAGHEDWVLALGLSRNGRRVISGDMASRVIVWDLAERRELARWSGYPWNWIVAAALSPNGETAAVSEHRYKRDDFDVPAPALRLYTVADGQPGLDFLATNLPNYNSQETTYGASQVWRKFVAMGLIAADFSPDGQWLAVVQGGETDTGKIHLLEVASGKALREIGGHPGGATDVRFSADGQYILSAGRDTTFRICRASDGQEVAALNTPRGGQFKDWLSSLAISPDEQTVAASDIAGLVHVWSL